MRRTIFVALTLLATSAAAVNRCEFSYQVEVTDPAKLPAKIEVLHRVERDRDLTGPNPEWDPARYLARTRKIPLDGVIAKLGARWTAGLTDPDDKRRALYRRTVETMTYSKQGKGWGEGDAAWACSSKRANGTDFHSLLIVMARSRGLASRFEIGFPLPPGGAGETPARPKKRENSSSSTARCRRIGSRSPPGATWCWSPDRAAITLRIIKLAQSIPRDYHWPLL
jgi:transglutaminase-like putative cysteine protease